MYLGTIQRRNKDGSVVRYVQLAHNTRHLDSGQSVAQLVYSFGREDQLDRAALARLARSTTRYLDDTEHQQRQPPPRFPRTSRGSPP